MDIIQITLLALVQGITEYLPISSSAHLILVPVLSGWEDQGLSFDIAVHVGSLFAVMLYFRREVIAITRDTTKTLFQRQAHTPDSQLGFSIILATIPIVIAGALLVSIVETDFRNPLVIASASIGFGLLLWAADRRTPHMTDLSKLSYKDALIIGLFQVLAIIPGTSRSGITMTAALLLGYSRTAASRFSFLLAIPTILMSGILVTLKMFKPEATVDWTALILGTLLSFIFAYLAIHFFLKLIEHTGMLPYVIYRVLLGVVLLAIFL